MAFESLSDKLQNVFKKLRGKGVLTEKDIKEALRESGVECKVRVDNPVQNRMSRDVAFGGNPLIINNIGVDTSANAYSVYVPKEKKEFAEAIVHGINRED